MNPILFAVILLPAIGLVAGIGLGIANHFMAVPENETAKKIRDELPGANCGACGFSGCQGYADALAESPNIKLTLCVVGGNEVAKKIGDILGEEAGETIPMRAVVRCAGSHDATEKRAEYLGIKTCKAASLVYNGGNACSFGCIGLGDCVSVCERNAIHICNGVAVVDPTLCFGCGQCVTACPKRVIQVLPALGAPYVPCRNTDKGADTKKVCSRGCVGCRLCEKACAFGAITVTGGLAEIDPEKCTHCGKCAEACKFGVIHLPEK